MMRRALILPALLLCGCVEFEKQTLTFRFDAANDRLLIFQHYEGIFGGSSGPGGADSKLEESEVKELDSVVNSQRTFFFANWIAEFHRKHIEENLKKLEEEIENQPEARTPKSAARAEQVKLIRLLLENVKIENGRFYLNAEKKLSGTQTVTVTRFSRVVEQINRTISASVLSGDIELDGKDVPDEVAARVKKAAEKNYTWLSARGGRIVLRFPNTPDGFRLLRTEIDSKLDDAIRAEDPNLKEIRRHWRIARHRIRSGFQLFHLDGITHLTVGDKESKQTKMSVTLSEKYKPNMVGHVREKYGIEESPDIKAKRERFLSGN